MSQPDVLRALAATLIALADEAEAPSNGGGEWFTRAEAQRRLGIRSRQTMHDAIHSGRIKAVKVGGVWKVPAAEVARIERGGM